MHIVFGAASKESVKARGKGRGSADKQPEEHTHYMQKLQKCFFKNVFH